MTKLHVGIGRPSKFVMSSNGCAVSDPLITQHGNGPLTTATFDLHSYYVCVYLQQVQCAWHAS